jgi:hypothetical protein
VTAANDPRSGGGQTARKSAASTHSLIFRSEAATFFSGYGSIDFAFMCLTSNQPLSIYVASMK